MAEGVRFTIPEWETFVEQPVTESNQLLLLTTIAMLAELTGQDEKTVWNMAVGFAAEGVAQMNKEYNG